MANGDIHKLGTLYVNVIKRPFPTKPWRSDTTPGGASGVGNILNYDSVNGNIEIKDTDIDDAYKLRFIEIHDGDKKLLISDRCLLARVSWDELNAQGLVSGKEITIDGAKYKIRLLSGGTNIRSGTDYFSGGSPVTNEWDRMITNESNFSGLPIPTNANLDSTIDSTDYNSIHNQFWNWSSMYSWCQDIYSPNSNYRVVRGLNTPRFFQNDYSYNRSVAIGWRPVLEVLNTIPSISINNQDLGDIANFINKSYSVTDVELDNFTLTEKLDGVAIRTLTNQVSRANYTLDLSSQWDSLSYGTHTIEIIADDGKLLGQSTITITFTKVKAHTLPIETATLDGLINHFDNISKDVDYEKFRLAQNLIAKGVTATSGEKLSSLVGKVGGIELGKKWASGTSTTDVNDYYSITVAVNFGFTPKTLIIIPNAPERQFCIYISTKIASSYDMMLASSATSGYEYKNLGWNSTYITDKGFHLSTSIGIVRPSCSVTWMAFE